MQQRFLSVEEFNHFINQWNGTTIKVAKHELEDLDEVLFNLDHVSYSSNPARIDDYIPRYALQLVGSGNVMTDMNNMQALPASTYDIPLDDDTLYERIENELIVSTSRAVYKIKQLQDHA